MTRKEKLFAEVNELVEKYNAMIDGHEGYRRRDKYENARWINWKCTELVNEIEVMKRMIAEFEMKLRVDAYWLTEEGVARKAALEERMTAITDAMTENHEMWEKGITEMIMSHLTVGDWVVRPRTSGCEIGLRDPEAKYPDGILFGHSFEFYYSDWNYKGDTKLELNYGTMGSFDPTVNTNRVIYLQGMAAIAGNTELINNLHQAFKQWNKILREQRKNYSILEKELKNPFTIIS